MSNSKTSTGKPAEDAFQNVRTKPEVIVNETSNSGKPKTGQVSQGESTQTGIFAGAEKFVASDVDAPKKAKEDLTNQGTGIVSSNGSLDFVDQQANGSAAASSSVTRSDIADSDGDSSRHTVDKKNAFSVNDLPPLPEFSAVDIDDADFLAWLHENNELKLDENTAKNIDPAVRKRYERYLAELQLRNRRQSDGLLPEARSRSNSTVSNASNNSINNPEAKSHRGPVKSLVHALHLDRGHRKKDKKKRQEEEARIRAEMDEAQWKERLIQQHERKLARASKRAGKVTGSESTSSDSEADNTTDSTQAHHAPTAVPLSLLNPDFIDKKNSEDDILQSGGDLASLSSYKDGEEGFTSVSSDRITQLIESDHQRQESGKDLQALEKEKNLTAEQFKVNFHTADSFDRLDRLSNSTPAKSA